VTTTDRLSVHGLSRSQRDAMRWLATAGREGSHPRRVATWVVLQRHALVAYNPDVTAFGGYSLTQLGWALFRGMFVDGAL
jgi:hypothetical protein